jgi:uncharacterized protein (DUF2062 family)
MNKRLARWLPTRESLHNNRWLRWLGPALHHPRLWHMSRKGLALGLALGIFFGLLVPVAQMPLSATLAVLLRANLPVAVASTLVTNPVTFGPVYYGAYHLGRWVLQEPALSDAAAARALEPEPAADAPAQGVREHLEKGWAFLTTVGKPLVVGLAIVASVCGVLVYFLASLLWIAKTRWTRRRRLARRSVAPR